MLSYKQYLQEKQVYHVSHKNFNTFDEYKIGSALGGLLIGWGFYFSDDKIHALGYKNQLQNKFIGNLDKQNEYYVNGKLVEESDAPQYLALINFLNIGYDSSKEESEWFSDEKWKEQYLKELEYIKNSKVEIKTISKNVLLYTVELSIKEDEFLLWDEPLHKQSQKIKDTLSKLNINDSNWTGNYIYKHVNKNFDDYKKTSKFLLKNGIKGVKAIYLTDEQPNPLIYVVFDSNDIKIKSKEK